MNFKNYLESLNNNVIITVCERVHCVISEIFEGNIDAFKKFVKYKQMNLEDYIVEKIDPWDSKNSKLLIWIVKTVKTVKTVK